MSLFNDPLAWLSGKRFQALKTTPVNGPQETSYGVQEVVQNHAFVRTAPIYNLLPANFRSFTATGGSAGVENRELKVSTGTSVGGYGAIQSFRSLNIEYGQTGLCRFAARFPNNQANCWQGCGLISIVDELSFGYDGTDFGVWHRYGGEVEVRTLTLTTGAGGAETATVTVNGTAYACPITAGTTAQNAKEIVDYLTANMTGFYAEQLSSTVVISAASDGPKNLTWSFSSTGTAAGSFAQTTAGVTKTSEHIAQADFNGQVPKDFDPSKGNLYSISYGAGYSNVDFRIFDKDYGHFILCHEIKKTNIVEGLRLNNPALRTGLYVASTGSTTDLRAYCSFTSAFGQGARVQTRNPRAYRNTKSISTTLTNLLTIRNKRIYNGLVNQAEIEPLLLTIANEGNKNLLVDIRGNPTVAGVPNFQDIGTNLIAEIDVAGTTVTEDGRFLASLTVAPGDSRQIDIEKLKVRLPPTLRMVIAVRQLTGGSAASVTGTLIWHEDI